MNPIIAMARVDETSVELSALDETFLGIFADFRRRLREKQAGIHVARRRGLRRNLPEMHFHENSELFLQVDGRRDFECPQEQFSLPGGSIAVIPPGVPHAERGYPLKGDAFRGVVLFNSGRGMALHLDMVRARGGKPCIAHYLHLSRVECERIRRLLEDVAEVGPEDVRVLLTDALLGLVEEAIRQPRQESAHQDSAGWLVGRVQATIHAYLGDSGLSVGSLAADAGCTPDHLSRCFRRECGVSVQGYLRRERLNLAKRLLVRRELRISEIAWSCGFNSLNYFIRTFREDTGLTPRHYRNELAEGKLLAVE